MRTVVLFSGGLDSTTLLAETVRKEGPQNVLALSLRYGSLHNDAEGRAADKIAEHLGVLRQIITLPEAIFAGGKSALMGQSEMPDDEYHDPMGHTPSATIVPFRNGVFIATAVAIANSKGYNRVALAVHANDAVGYAYYDCMPEFLRPMAEAVIHGTHNEVNLDFPYFRTSKAGIVEIAAEIAAPLELSWSCYRGGEFHCGKCPTCLERQKAFWGAGFQDPTFYEVSPIDREPEGLADYPTG